MARKKTNIKDIVVKVKEGYQNLDDKEKEVLKEGVKEVVAEVKEQIETRKTTGKWNLAGVIGAVALMMALWANVKDFSESPVTEGYVDSVANAKMEIVVDSIQNLLDESNATIKELEGETADEKDTREDLISYDKDGNIKIGK